MPLKVLFVCTHNACRSVLGEVIGNRASELECASAGSAPSGRIHPETMTNLARHGYDTTGLESNGFEAAEAFSPDVVITVCDSAANEPCPVWMQTNVVRVHWGLRDPSQAGGDADSRERMFDAVIDVLQRRIKLVTNENLDGLSDQQLHAVFEKAERSERPRY